LFGNALRIVNYFHVVVETTAVVDLGVIRSTVAAFLHADGHDVMLCGRTPREQIEVRRDGHDPIMVPDTSTLPRLVGR
jgi:2-dehydropantoate 2-reductase